MSTRWHSVTLCVSLAVLAIGLQGCNNPGPPFAPPKHGTAFNGGMGGVLAMEVMEKQRVAQQAENKAMHAEEEGSKKASEFQEIADEKAREAKKAAKKLFDEARRAENFAKNLHDDVNEIKKDDDKTERDEATVKKEKAKQAASDKAKVLDHDADEVKNDEDKVEKDEAKKPEYDEPKKKCSANGLVIKSPRRVPYAVASGIYGAVVVAAIVVLVILGTVLVAVARRLWRSDARCCGAKTLQVGASGVEALRDVEAPE
eukprot:gnl/TRDRNA2_/TRDRNA2_173529_c3_seq2.p1 gnl/TRDRNA2_/TRDRNA2_173529_c3~~gnl/TRDRNA2_/TRDRNA2_173529_c3_seq2.p1  ORF type:complete len:258 (+),score=64.86 gnl/TRDRNA2_/TRDRNA2_173529_c3_seq2:77-850(+)